MAGKQRPIDAPSPPWRLMPATTDEVPIPKVDDEPTSPPDDGIDKAELARQLAEKAKADIEVKRAAEAEKKQQKANLATELAARARAELEARKAAKQEKADLAAELAAKAKAQHEARQAAKASSEPAPEAAPPKKVHTNSLAERASRPTKKQKMSAQEALAAALAAEEEAAAKKKASRKQTPRAVEPEPIHPAITALASALPGSTLRSQPRNVDNKAVFTALWKAHLAKAQKSGDPQLVATATHLLAAVESGPITALEVQLGEAVWAVWLDERGSLLGAAQPAATYLKGL